MSGNAWRSQWRRWRTVNAVLQEETADLIDHRGSLPNQPVSHAMQSLKIELRVRLCWHTSCRCKLHCFCDRKCIAEVILVGLPEGLGIDRWDLPNIVANGDEFTGHIMRSHAYLYTDRYVRKPSHNPVASYLLPQGNLSSGTKPDQVQRVLPGIDSNRDYYGVGFTRHGRCSFCDCPTSLLLCRGRSTAGPSHSRESRLSRTRPAPSARRSAAFACAALRHRPARSIVGRSPS